MTDHSFLLDRFDFTIDKNSPNHSSGAISASIAGLDTSERYQTKNLLLTFVIPPKDPNVVRFQHYLDLLVDDLLALCYDGMVIKTSSGKFQYLNLLEPRRRLIVTFRLAARSNCSSCCHL